jgi:monofunctional biosynthetic peptidoglycan transglycosylase
MKKFALLLVVLIFGIALSGGIFIYSQIPSEKEIRGCIVTKMYHVNLCPGSSSYSSLHSISPYLQKAVILTEDSNFWNHKGFDWEAIEKNAKVNWEKGEYARGGSTITQQLAKNMFLYKEKSLLRKGLEAIITDKIEKTLKKKEILERYLNVVEFGKDIYGVKAAARFYFKKSSGELNVAESSFLAMLLPSPVKYSRSYFKKDLSSFARKRMTQIISSMYRYNRITQTEYDIATTQLESFFSNSESVAQPVDMGSSDDIITLEDLEKIAVDEEEDYE